MYEPKLARFMSRDPLPENGPDIFYPVPDMRRYYKAYSEPYVHSQNDPINRIDPSELQAAPPAPPAPPLGTWRCARRPTTQTTGRVEFDETFTRDCANCTEVCRIKVTANRCFHESVEIGDDRDPRNFFTEVSVEFQRTGRVCDNGQRLPDTTFHLGGCRLYPGRLVFPGGPLSDKVMDYVTSLTSCEDFKLGELCQAAQTVPPHTPLP